MYRSAQQHDVNYGQRYGPRPNDNEQRPSEWAVHESNGQSVSQPEYDDGTWTEVIHPRQRQGWNRYRRHETSRETNYRRHETSRKTNYRRPSEDSRCK